MKSVKSILDRYDELFIPLPEEQRLTEKSLIDLERSIAKSNQLRENEDARAEKYLEESMPCMNDGYDEIITVKDILNDIAESMTNTRGKEYIVNCFEYKNRYEFVGTKHDYPLWTEDRIDKFISINTEGYDTDNIYCGYINYPEEYPDFYTTEDFILVKHFVNDFDQELSTIIDKKDVKEYLRHIYGLPQDIRNDIIKKYTSDVLKLTKKGKK